MMKIMTVNDNRTLYKLTTGEIYVLAGLLGYNTVYGTESNTLDGWRDDIDGNVSQAVTALTDSGYIEISFGGTLYIGSNLKTMIDCLCKPETITSAVISAGNCRSERYIISAGGKSVTLERNKNGRAYRMLLSRDCNDFDVSHIIGKASDMNAKNEAVSQLQLPYECAETAKTLISRFREEDAKELLEKHLTHKDAEKVFGILSGNTYIITVKTYRMNEGMCRCVYNKLLAAGTVNAEISTDNKRNIRIKYIASDAIEKIKSNISLL